MSQRHKRILLGQLNSNGDCLYATAVARQIKTDYPGCHLTWAVGSMCRSILDGNPHVDEVWEIPLASAYEIDEVWPGFQQAASARLAAGEFDEMFLTQISPGNLHLYDGTIRSSILRAYGKPITVPITPVLRLSAAEVENVRRFADSHRLSERTWVLLFECSAKSGQSFMTPEFALEVAYTVVRKFAVACVILSSNIPIDSGEERILDGSVLSLRENAELTKYCSLLVGGSSGVSWISSSDWAKPLPMIQLLKEDSFWFASMAHDHEYWGLSTADVIEMTSGSADEVVECIETVLTAGFPKAKARFHQDVKPRFGWYNYFLASFMAAGEYKKATSLLKANIERHGLRAHFVLFYVYNLLRSIAPLSLLEAARTIKRGVKKV
jgi:hypothetical protein